MQNPAGWAGSAIDRSRKEGYMTLVVLIVLLVLLRKRETKVKLEIEI
jgi:hypothetical protein